MGEVPLYLKFLVKLTGLKRIRSIFARSDSAVTPREKVQSPLRAF